MILEGGFDHGPDVPQEHDVLGRVALGDGDGEWLPVSKGEPAEGLASRVRPLDGVVFQQGGSEAEDTGGIGVHGYTSLGVVVHWSSEGELHGGADGERAIESAPGVGA